MTAIRNARGRDLRPMEVPTDTVLMAVRDVVAAVAGVYGVALLAVVLAVGLRGVAGLISGWKSFRPLGGLYSKENGAGEVGLGGRVWIKLCQSKHAESRHPSSTTWRARQQTIPTPPVSAPRALWHDSPISKVNGCP